MSLKRILRELGRVFRNRNRPVLRKQVQMLEHIYRLDMARYLDAARAASGSSPLMARGRKVFSQNDEDGIIEAIWSRLAPGRAGSFIELGVGDGTENNTLNLLAQGWRGAWLGGEDLAFEPMGTKLRFHKCWIDLQNVVALVLGELQTLGVAQPDLLSLDLDGNDWHFAQAILQAQIRPRVFVLEYNPLFAPETRWVMPYNANHQWDLSTYYGASLYAFAELLQAHGYRLVGCNVVGVNAFFIREEDSEAFGDVSRDIRDLYMPARHWDNAYPYFGHPVTLRTIQDVANH